MKIEVFTGIGAESNPLTIIEHHCPHCGMRVRMPAETIIDRVADEIERYYQRHNEYLEAENKKLREIVLTGNQIDLIKRVANTL